MSQLPFDEDTVLKRVLHTWDEHLAHPSLPRTLAPQMRVAGFRDVTSEAHVFASIDYDTEIRVAPTCPYSVRGQFRCVKVSCNPAVSGKAVNSPQCTWVLDVWSLDCRPATTRY